EARVGRGGLVAGAGRTQEMVDRARQRAEQRGVARVEFVEGDVHDPVPGGPFDAIIERLVLMWVPDPAEVLGRQATVLRAGGLVVPVEIDLAMARSLPATPLVSHALSLLVPASP